MTKAEEKRLKRPHWVSVVSVMVPSERTPETAVSGQLFVHVRTMIDSLGRLFQKVGRDPPERLEDPPEET